MSSETALLVVVVVVSENPFPFRAPPCAAGSADFKEMKGTRHATFIGHGKCQETSNFEMLNFLQSTEVLVEVVCDLVGEVNRSDFNPVHNAYQLVAWFSNPKRLK